MARRSAALDELVAEELRWGHTEEVCLCHGHISTCHPPWAAFPDAGRRLVSTGANELALWNTFLAISFRKSFRGSGY
jgi:hypothetical protein